MSRLYYPRPATADQSGASIFKSEDAPDPKPAPPNGGEHAKKIAKLIPTEIVTGYVGLVAAIPAINIPSVNTILYWFVFFLCFALTPVFLKQAADKDKPSRNQIIVGTLAFPIWAYLVSGSVILGPPLFNPGLAVVITLAFSLITAAIPMQPVEGPPETN